ncbi:MAG TPA: riboflavin biosynthesis protein RibF [Ruminococcaceae bacterium]|nr:riboflavin biosynthesis protein RibF [Oscillospiraceae bacterium]
MSNPRHSQGPGAAAALGYFDGVHIGHAEVLSAAVRHGDTAAAVTFGRLPKKSSGRILTESVRNRRIRGLGINEIITLDFEQVRDYSPEAFIRFLKAKLGIKFVSCGYDFRFGKNALGDAALLTKLCLKEDMRPLVLEPVLFGEEPVSSTNIRRRLEAGDISAVNKMLSLPYEFDFTVSVGDRRGRTWGFPTINQVYGEDFALPKFGVYASKVFVDGKWRAGVTNIGTRPMFRADKPLAETYIPNFDGDLYGRNIPVRLYKYLRGEKKFSSDQTLREEIAKNVKESEKLACHSVKDMIE